MPTGKDQARLGKQTDSGQDLTTTTTTPHPPHTPPTDKDHLPHIPPPLPPQAKRPPLHPHQLPHTGKDQARLGKQTDNGQAGEFSAASWQGTVDLVGLAGGTLTTTPTTTTPPTTTPQAKRPPLPPHTHPHHQLCPPQAKRPPTHPHHCPTQAKRPHTHHSPTTPTGQDQARLGKQTDNKLDERKRSRLE